MKRFIASYLFLFCCFILLTGFKSGCGGVSPDILTPKGYGLEQDLQPEKPIGSCLGDSECKKEEYCRKVHNFGVKGCHVKGKLKHCPGTCTLRKTPPTPQKEPQNPSENGACKYDNDCQKGQICKIDKDPKTKECLLKNELGYCRGTCVVKPSGRPDTSGGSSISDREGCSNGEVAVLDEKTQKQSCKPRKIKCGDSSSKLSCKYDEICVETAFDVTLMKDGKKVVGSILRPACRPKRHPIYEAPCYSELDCASDQVCVHLFDNTYGKAIGHCIEKSRSCKASDCGGAGICYQQSFEHTCLNASKRKVKCKVQVPYCPVKADHKRECNAASDCGTGQYCSLIHTGKECDEYGRSYGVNACTPKQSVCKDFEDKSTCSKCSENEQCVVSKKNRPCLDGSKSLRYSYCKVPTVYCTAK